MIKISARNFTLRFDDSMSSFSSENKINYIDNLIYTAQNCLFKFVTFTCIIYVFSPCTVYIKLSIYFILFSLENDDMESSKRSVKFLSLIFIIRCKRNLLTKCVITCDQAFFCRRSAKEKQLEIGVDLPTSRASKAELGGRKIYTM